MTGAATTTTTTTSSSTVSEIRAIGDNLLRDDPSKSGDENLLGATVTLMLPSGTMVTALVVGLMSTRPHATEVTTRATVVSAHGDWFTVGDKHVALGALPIQRRLLRALANRHETAPGSLTKIADLAAEVWPGERLVATSARQRIHSLVHRLRRIGLVDAIIGTREGYALSANVRIASSLLGIADRTTAPAEPDGRPCLRPEPFTDAGELEPTL